MAVRPLDLRLRFLWHQRLYAGVRGRTLALIEAGFIVGYANVRGGGEYGRDWHKAGQLANKPNTWRDLIDVCEELCAKKYTSRSRLAIGGRSAAASPSGAP